MTAKVEGPLRHSRTKVRSMGYAGFSGTRERGCGVDEVLFRPLADGVLDYLPGVLRDEVAKRSWPRIGVRGQQTSPGSLGHCERCCACTGSIRVGTAPAVAAGDGAYARKDWSNRTVFRVGGRRRLLPSPVAR
jgi:hypothetical protein